MRPRARETKITVEAANTVFDGSIPAVHKTFGEDSQNFPPRSTASLVPLAESFFGQLLCAVAQVKTMKTVRNCFDQLGPASR
jgi:hypothetical protein